VIWQLKYIYNKIRKLQAIGAYPPLFNKFMEINGHLALSKLIFHDNIDIAIEAIKILIDLTDHDYSEQVKGAEYTKWIDYWVYLLIKESKNIVRVCATLISQLDPSVDDENESIYHILCLADNVLEHRKSLIKQCYSAGLILQLIRLIAGKQEVGNIDQSTLYSSEILHAIIHQSDDLTTISQQSTENILLVINYYRKLTVRA
jgi:hypothetical protein